MIHERRILVTGGNGQIGLELARVALPTGYVIERPGCDILDISSERSVENVVAQGRWDAIINCAAWTAVDLAEDHLAAAFLVNCQGAANLAQAAKRLGIPMVHLSTDYVFDGKLDRPYRETDAVAPLNVYGASKLAGELAIASSGTRFVVLRTAWVISAQRNNFLKTMLQIGTTNPTVRVVNDQRGCPTSAADIAEVAIKIAARLIDDSCAPTGVYHFVNDGEASWCELATRIFEASARQGGPASHVVPISTADYPTRAIRPANSRLTTDKLQKDYGFAPRHWHDAVSEIVAELHSVQHKEAISR